MLIMQIFDYYYPSEIEYLGGDEGFGRRIASTATAKSIRLHRCINSLSIHCLVYVYLDMKLLSSEDSGLIKLNSIQKIYILIVAWIEPAGNRHAKFQQNFRFLIIKLNLNWNINAMKWKLSTEDGIDQIESFVPCSCSLNHIQFYRLKQYFASWQCWYDIRHLNNKILRHHNVAHLVRVEHTNLKCYFFLLIQ